MSERNTSLALLLFFINDLLLTYTLGPPRARGRLAPSTSNPKSKTRKSEIQKAFTRSALPSNALRELDHESPSAFRRASRAGSRKSVSVSARFARLVSKVDYNFGANRALGRSNDWPVGNRFLKMLRGTLVELVILNKF